ncbi:putative bifunctional diguanylate cyclase/phosphodiesterase [Aeromonas cavernicola]|uniref:GGDEF-domain containing protein n=1 Tax=Aeromonas cavernicola TaxID=1006623 RepID=A0A2H9U8F4_9GAMM|nr:bifunctional diguanylate cyclase/phosphodiesterase [Aeromonas cavernicola]PJG60291.1 GGDEF-domain containing protein [Aeromonas cavernicola]
MSSVSTAAHYSTPLLALISTIMDFPSPSAAACQDYDALVEQINPLCPLHQFGIVGCSEHGLQWIYNYQISDSFKQQLGHEPSRITEQLTQLDETNGWCVLPIEHRQMQWLLARCQPTELPTLRLLLECLAKRLAETQANCELNEPASPLIRTHPDWQKKIESITRIIRLANVLPSQALFSQLEAVLRQILAIHDMLLVHATNLKVDVIYPVEPHQSDAFISELCHSTSNVEAHRESLHWHSMPLRLQQQYFAHFIISTPQPLEADDKLFLDFLRGQLTLLLELRRIRQQLNEINSEDSINQRLQQLRQTNLRLQKQLRQHQELERKLQFDALHDPLTRLPNRALLMNHLNHAMTHFRRHKSAGFTVIFIDVDHFRRINESAGHGGGDQLLREISRRLKTCIRQNDMVARLGGDEFVIYLDSSQHEQDISPVLNRIVHRLAYPFRINGNELTITVSQGVASVGAQTTDVSQLLHQADLAMFQAKRNGRGRIVSYSDDCISQHWHSPEETLARALREGRIVPYFQPVIRLEDSRLAGLEVMARWITEEGAIREAFDFIPLAEQCDLIQELDRQILRQSCQQLKTWLTHEGQSKLKVAINLSGKHLTSRQEILQLMAIIEAEGIAPNYLIFEFNERELSRQDADALTSLHELRAKGIQVSLDAFGTGFSSLNALFHFPVDYIKVDDSFTQRMLQSPKDLALIRAMGDICRDLGYTLVVEGIENQQQLQKLIDIGCQLGQGRYISPPMQGTDIVPLLAAEAVPS